MTAAQSSARSGRHGRSATNAIRPFPYGGAFLHPAIFLRHLLPLLLLLSLVAAPAAYAGLSAEAELGYVNYDSQQVGGNRSASAFAQRYSLLYATGARLGSGQTGYYLLAGGYEWASVNSSIHSGDSNGDTTISRNVGHILYSGELLYDPRELPIRVKAYSRDLSRAWYSKTSAAYVFTGIEPVIDPGISNDVHNGTNITTGLLLTIGLKNSMSNGYYSVFKDLPKLLVDYWDNIRQDTSADTAVDTRQRRLAVVLNKKENWIHYRRNTYDDYLQPTQSLDEQKIIIGQIDESLDRQWVDLTNWIKISADGTFMKRVDAGGVLTNETDVNLMTILTREKWQARTINSYSHAQATDGTYTYSSRNPVYLSGIWGSDADWLTRFNYGVDKWQYATSSPLSQTDTYGSVQLNTFKRSNFTLSTMVGLESFEQNQDKSFVSELRVESASTRRFSDTVSLVGSYDVKWVRSEGSVNGDSIVQTLSGSAVYRLSNRVTAELGQEFDAGSGARNTNSGTIIITPQTADSRFGSIPDSYVRSYSRARLNWAVSERLQTLAAATQDFVMESGNQTSSLTSLTHMLTYRQAGLNVETELRYSRMSGRENSDGVLAGASASYVISRATSAGMKARYSYDRVAGSAANKELEVLQNLGHNYFSYSGQGRKLLELVETFRYLQREGIINETRKTAKLNARYFPTRHIYLAGSLAYSWVNYFGDSTEFAGTSEVGVEYSKLQASLGYSYGRRDGQSYDNRIDKRFAANLRKQF